MTTDLERPTPEVTDDQMALIRDTIAVLDALRCTDAERAAMFEGNAKQMLELG